MPINKYIKCGIHIHRILHSVIKRNEVLICTTTWINTELCHTQKSKYCSIPFIRKIWNGQFTETRSREWVPGAGLEEGNG